MERKETAADLNLKNLCLEKSIWARNAGFWEALSYLCRNDTSQKQVASFLSCLWACKYQTNCWIRKDCEWEWEGRICCVILLKIGEDGQELWLLDNSDVQREEEERLVTLEQHKTNHNWIFRICSHDPYLTLLIFFVKNLTYCFHVLS